MRTVIKGRPEHFAPDHESGSYSRHKRIRRLADYRILSLEDYESVIRGLTVRDPRAQVPDELPRLGLVLIIVNQASAARPAYSL